MSSINTNTVALNAAFNLDRSQDLLNASLSRLSSGSSMISPADDPAGTAVADSLTGENGRLTSASTNVQNTLSYAQTADGYLSSMGDVLNRLSELATESNDPAKNASDDASYEVEFKSLQDQLRSMIGGSSSAIGGSSVTSPSGAFNGTTLFGSTPAGGVTVEVGDDASQSLTIPDIDLQAGAMQAIIGQDSSGNYTMSATTSGAIASITNAIQQVGSGRATLGAAESRLNLTASTIATEQQNISSAISGISDVNVATESTQLAKYNILVQSSASMLAQANHDPESVLKLIQS
ncbi:MAG TPA: flagellin [Opitutaceae bacterium]